MLNITIRNSRDTFSLQNHLTISSLSSTFVPHHHRQCFSFSVSSSPSPCSLLLRSAPSSPSPTKSLSQQCAVLSTFIRHHRHCRRRSPYHNTVSFFQLINWGFHFLTSYQLKLQSEIPKHGCMKPGVLISSTELRSYLEKWDVGRFIDIVVVLVGEIGWLYQVVWNQAFLLG